VPDLLDTLKLRSRHLDVTNPFAKLERDFWRQTQYVTLDGHLYRVTSNGTRWKELPVRAKKRRNARWKHRHPKSGYRVHKAGPRYRQQQLPGISVGSSVVPGVTVMGKYKTFVNNKLTSSFNILNTGSASLSSGFRRTWDRTNPGPPYSQGGPFKKIEYHIAQGERKGFGVYSSKGNPAFPAGSYREYTGDFCTGNDWGTGNSTDFSTSALSDFTNLSAYHTLAWDKTSPRVSKAGIAQFIVELRELPTMLATTANLLHNSWRSFGGGYSSIVMHPSSVADNFLNHNFGWVPFINDLLSLWDTYENSHKYIAQTVRDNGRWLRRKSVLETTESTIRASRFFHSSTDPNSLSVNMEPLLAPMVVDGTTCKALTDIYDTNVSQVWAVGSFKYYRPEFDDNLADFSGGFNTVKRLLTIYGARINPTVVWKLTPWTWAIDWFTSVGKFIEHHDQFIEDGVVSRYLYCMKSTERRLLKSTTFNWYSGPRNLNWFRRLNYKQREVADSPYGFNQPWNSLSAKQWAILGAIGITRLNGGFIAHGA